MGIHTRSKLKRFGVYVDDVIRCSSLHKPQDQTFLSDISGAFDRVSKEILLSKLKGFGVGETCLRFLDSYLAPRVGNVVVQGKLSENMTIDNNVFQVMEQFFL